MATTLLEHNKLNRPLRQRHVERIAAQIIGGHWKFNGDTIKLASSGDVLDGQHRLWAVIEAKLPIETIVVRDIEADAFSTIDTLRAPRSGADVLALAGLSRYRGIASMALTWLIRYQRGTIERFRDPENRVENADIEVAFAENPQIIRAVERCAKFRGIVNTSTLSFVYYITVNRDEVLAEQMLDTLRNPAGVPIDDPFFRLRVHLTSRTSALKDPLVTIAVAIKAINAAARGQTMRALSWRSQGDNPEPFPKLDIPQTPVEK